MEASALRNAARAPVLTGLSPHLRLQSDERLVALIRRGHHGAFEALVKRYNARLLAFCRHMLNSNEDAEDVLQEVFAASYRAMCADEREINVRPWLYRIARNRCLNHLRRPRDAGQESMDVFEREAGATAADTVHRREEFRQVIADVQDLPETQRTALLLREIDALSYDQIAAAMETTVPSVKSLLVRARISLAEASEARHLTCAEVRLELTQASEGLTKATAPARRHVRSCPRCKTFRRELRRTSHALAAVLPAGPLIALQKLLGAKAAGMKLGGLGAKVGAGAAAEGAGGGALLGGGAGLISAGAGSLAAKAAAGIITAALVTAGAVEMKRGSDSPEPTASAPAAHDRAALEDRQLREPLPVGTKPEAHPVVHASSGPEPSPEPERAAVEPAPEPAVVEEEAPIPEEPVVAEEPVPADDGTDAPPPDDTYEGDTIEPTDPAVEPPDDSGTGEEPPPTETDGGALSPPSGSGGFPGTTTRP